MPKGRFTRLTDEQAITAFGSDEDVLALSKQLGCTHATLTSRWRLLFGEEGYRMRKYRMHSNAVSGEKHPAFGKPGLRGEAHPMFGKTGEASTNYKGGKPFIGNGYWRIAAPEWWTGPVYGIKTPNERGWVYGHQVSYAEHHNLTEIPRGMHIHHVNNDTLDNSPENLEMLTKSQHWSRHQGYQAGLEAAGQEAQANG